jgi:hypothetical protein
MEGDYYEDVDVAWTMMRGTLIHGSLEQFPYPMRETVREMRMEMLVETKYGPQTFTAKPDVFVIQSLDMENKVIHIKVIDYKTREFGHELVRADYKHQMQVNMYAWLAIRSLGFHYQGSYDWTVEVDELEIIYLNLQKTRRFTSACSLEARKRKKVSGHWEYETYALAPIRMLPMEKVEAFIRAKIEQKIQARAVLPPPLEGEAAKFCWRCPVYATCQSLADREEELESA